MENKLLIIVAIIVFIGLIFAGKVGIEKHERDVECKQWQKRELDWTPANWQVEQCERYGIDLQ